MITMGKGLGNGVGIIAAVICRKSIADAFAKKMFFNTYACNPFSSVAARMVLKIMKEDKLNQNCQK